MSRAIDRFIFKVYRKGEWGQMERNHQSDGENFSGETCSVLKIFQVILNWDGNFNFLIRMLCMLSYNIIFEVVIILYNKCVSMIV